MKKIKITSGGGVDSHCIKHEFV